MRSFTEVRDATAGVGSETVLAVVADSRVYERETFSCGGGATTTMSRIGGADPEALVALQRPATGARG